MNLVPDLFISYELVDELHLFVPFEEVLLELYSLVNLKGTDNFVHIAVELDLSLAYSPLTKSLWA
jgi:hypothetical protein